MNLNYLKIVFKLEVERDELELKLTKLTAFLNDKARLAEVSKEQNQLLHQQYYHMQQYHRILNERITDLVEEL